ncbi:MAG: hypothetical protein KAH17_04815 [Bacteroidales bacterium]|nr:hypothetical protein [Bacteroidales bacterium]
MGIIRLNKNIDLKSWYRLDNAAKIFPAVTNKVRTSVFRLSVDLHEAVKLEPLQKALDKTLLELPYFRSQLKKGFFWYWLEPSEAQPLIQYDQGAPCREFNTQGRNHLLIRILARENKISAEFMHTLTDGGGASTFFTSLISNYGQFCKWAISPEDQVITDRSIDQKDLTEDSYKKYFRKHIPKHLKIRNAYHLPFEIHRKPKFRTLIAELSTSKLIALAHEKKISLTEYLASVYLFTLQKFYLLEYNKRPFPRKSILRVEIPVNLRKLFPSKTLRNFALFVMPEIDPRLGAYSFDEITSIVHHYMQLETDHRQIQRIIRRNVGGEKNPIIRIIPLILKVMVLTLMFKNSGPKLYSGVLTNLGPVKISADYTKFIKRFRFIPPPPDPSIKVNSALISYHDSLVLCFGNQSTSTKFEREFLRFLKNEGLNITILNS